MYLSIGEIDMRNLKAYPITLDEIEQCLLCLAEELSKDELVGDMRPLLLQKAAEIVGKCAVAAEAIEKIKTEIMLGCPIAESYQKADEGELLFAAGDLPKISAKFAIAQ
jgi:hypothetical protein